MTPYRQSYCHLCSAVGERVCPTCSRPVCDQHTAASCLEEAPRRQQTFIRAQMERLGGENVCRYCLEQAPAVSEPWIVVYRGSDVLEAQLLFGLLRSDGFAARLLGTQTAALLGAAQHVFELRIEVASPEADEAFALISAFRREERSCGHGQEDS